MSKEHEEKYVHISKRGLTALAIGIVMLMITITFGITTFSGFIQEQSTPIGFFVFLVFYIQAISNIAIPVLFYNSDLSPD
jgi:F0F1-type ATP synthase membrane subunit a